MLPCQYNDLIVDGWGVERDVVKCSGGSVQYKNDSPVGGTLSLCRTTSRRADYSHAVLHKTRSEV